MKAMDNKTAKQLLEYNRTAWNRQVETKNQWTQPVTSETIAAARKGDWSIVLTPEKPVPRDWFPPLDGLATLCLASGGGQQGPILAAAGAEVTVYDYSEMQLAQDRFVADRDGLSIATIQGDMANLDQIADEFFDLIVHPCSNVFVPNVLPVWKEAHRVLKKGGTLLSGFSNPVSYLFDYEKSLKGILDVRFKIPYSDLESLSETERQKYMNDNEPLCFGHTLQDQIGGQIDAGFAITGFYEDSWDESEEPINKYIDCFIATRALKA